MTYEEFKEMIEKTGEYQVSDERTQGTMVYKEEWPMCYISKTRTFGVDTINSGNGDFLEKYGDIISKFARTPVKERYPVKKYYVKLDLPEKFSNEQQYLNKMTMSDGTVRYLWGEKKKEPSTYISPLEIGVIYQTQFTMEEIEKMIPEKDRIKFKIVPVEEEN